MAFGVSRKKNINILKVGIKIVGAVIALYASGFMLRIIGDIMNGTASPFYVGLRLIGWTVGNPTTNGTAGWFNDCGVEGAAAVSQTSPTSVCLTSTSGTGMLSIVGLLAIVWILFEFVDIRI